MKTRWYLVAISVLAAVRYLLPSNEGSAGAQPESESITVSAPAVGREEAVLVGTLRGRGFAVHLFTGDLYSIEDHSGELVGVHLTSTEFADQFPDIYAATQDVFASEPIADNLASGDALPLGRWAGTP